MALPGRGPCLAVAYCCRGHTRCPLQSPSQFLSSSCAPQGSTTQPAPGVAPSPPAPGVRSARPCSVLPLDCRRCLCILLTGRRAQAWTGRTGGLGGGAESAHHLLRRGCALQGGFIRKDPGGHADCVHLCAGVRAADRWGQAPVLVRGEAFGRLARGYSVAFSLGPDGSLLLSFLWRLYCSSLMVSVGPQCL